MITKEFNENIIPYIGESNPYCFIPEKITINNDEKIELEILNIDFNNKKFSDLLKILSSIGSTSLYKLIDKKSNEKIYFLGEKLRIRKLSYSNDINNIVISSRSILESKRKGKSYLKVRDKFTNLILYTFELDYYIISKNNFEKIYSDFYNNIKIEFYDENLPETSIITLNDFQFNIKVNSFSPNNCKGHFENYPIVPAVFITNCILKELLNFLNKDNNFYEVDSLEMYLSKAMPTGKEFFINVIHEKLLKDITFFNCEVLDENQISYGKYLIFFKSNQIK